MCNSDSPFSSKPISFRYKWYQVSFSLEKGSQADHSLQILICESPSLHQCPLSCSPSHHIQALKSRDSSSAILLLTPLLSFTTNLLDLLNPHFLATPDLSPCFWSLCFKPSSTLRPVHCSSGSSAQKSLVIDLPLSTGPGPSPSSENSECWKLSTVTSAGTSFSSLC